MIKAVLSNNDIVHEGNFGINVVIDKPVSDLSITDFIFVAESGNGITNIELPDNIETANGIRNKSTLCMIPVDLPENVSGSFRVSMQDRQYMVNNIELGISEDAINTPETELMSLVCDAKVFSYRT